MISTQASAGEEARARNITVARTQSRLTKARPGPADWLPGASGHTLAGDSAVVVCERDKIDLHRGACLWSFVVIRNMNWTRNNWTCASEEAEKEGERRRSAPRVRFGRGEFGSESGR